METACGLWMMELRLQIVGIKCIPTQTKEFTPQRYMLFLLRVVQQHIRCLLQL